ncbi:MAG: ATP-dependent DNA helicase RecG [Candidatus Andersenbacteria bacterium]
MEPFRFLEGILARNLRVRYAHIDMLRLSSPITEAPRIGPAKAKLFEKLRITHIRDLLYTFPRRYDDFSQVTAIKDLEIGRQMTVKARVVSAKSLWGFQGRRRVLRIFVELEDDTATLQVTWYNLRFLEKQLIVGREIYVAGTVEPYKGRNKDVEFAMRSPALEFADSDSERLHTAAITPIYPETHGITSRFIRYQVKKLLPLIETIPEYLPKDIIARNNLMGIHEAIRIVHFPEDQDHLADAQRRLRFDELFFLQLAALVRRQHLQRADTFPLHISDKKLGQFIKTLPFVLTGAQQESLQEIRQDLEQPHPMNRLLQGDVGAGKSAVALITAHIALEAGYKVIYLAPTEILARQQALSFAEGLSPFAVHLLIGAMKTREKQTVKALLVSSDPVCVVGTHALLQEDVIGENIGLVIVDEQHRFGVDQRRALTQVQPEAEPHLLSMTATPIPRTLSLTVYGDLDVSVLDELPPGRKPVETSIVPTRNRDRAIVHVLRELHAGHQAYVIAPLVEESDKLELKSAKQAYEEMQQLFPGIAIGLMHGQLSSEEKEGVMKNFAAGAIQLLVSTAVVEVGVNVPNATMMIIEGAERFGLAQLHQFRGRIGRGQQQSYCYLFPTTDEAATSRRLQVLEQTTDGFKIAEEDLKLRGPGEVYGVSQSGFGDLKVASLLDYETIKLARTEAENILAGDPQLQNYPILQKKVEQKNLQTHFE